VGGWIGSNNYVQGSAGWAIAGNGAAEFASAVIRGQLTAGQITDLSIDPSKIRDNSAMVLTAGSRGNDGQIYVPFWAGNGGHDYVRYYIVWMYLSMSQADPNTAGSFSSGLASLTARLDGPGGPVLGSVTLRSTRAVLSSDINNNYYGVPAASTTGIGFTVQPSVYTYGSRNLYFSTYSLSHSHLIDAATVILVGQKK
jgi:hypothetical protein